MLDASEVDILGANAFRFRAKGIFEFPESNAKHVSLRFDGVDYAFEREGDDWTVTTPANKRWDVQSDMKALLKALSTARMKRRRIADATGRSGGAGVGRADPQGGRGHIEDTGIGGHRGIGSAANRAKRP